MRKPRSRILKLKKAPPKQAKAIAKDRRHERAITIKAVSHVTAEQFFERHKYCINMQEIYEMMKDPEMGVIISENIPAHKAVCDHPEDGYCFHGYPNPEILQKINDKLAFRVARPKEKDDDLVVKEEIAEEAEIPVVVRTIGKFTIKLGREK